jgi:lysophospholipase L1-like esterase
MMSMSFRDLFLTFVSLLLWSPAAPGQVAAPLVLKDGDRVVLLGSALVEHEQLHGYLETRLISRFPQANVTFRNLGWSGDTVRGVARTSGFQNPDGFARLLKEVRAQKPTVLFVGYGSNESFAGPAGLPGFLDGFGTLLDQLRPLGAKIIVLSPTPHENLGPPFPDPAEHNRNLEVYTLALQKLAGERRLRFLDLFHPLRKIAIAEPKQHLTSNGLLPNEYGYWLLAREVEQQLVGGERSWSASIDRSGKVLAALRAAVGKVKAGPDGLVFDIIPAVLPAPPAPLGSPPLPRSVLRVTGLESGQYVLSINGREEKRARAEEWANPGVYLWPAAALRQTANLRAAVIRKNEHFYRRWRPFNDHERHWTYIGGDFKLYDDQVAQEETVIGVLRRPATLHCAIRPVKGEK